MTVAYSNQNVMKGTSVSNKSSAFFLQIFCTFGLFISFHLVTCWHWACHIWFTTYMSCQNHLQVTYQEDSTHITSILQQQNAI